tara:strand:- start:92 stop:868 length:777 start_codon:yes stop_codon:yes gene_type:complete
MKKKFLISVVTPNYNGAYFLEESIKSVINQSHKEFEYIIIDGKSKDNSIKILQKYKKKISKLIIKKDKGIYDAVEKGIKLAKGEIIIWINSDDLLHKDAVKNVSILFNKRPDLNWVSGVNGYIKFGYKFFGIPYIYPNIIMRKGWARHDLWGYLQQESVSFKKALFLKSKGFGLKPTIAGDYKLWTKFARISSLKTYNIKIGYFRTWSGQDSQLRRQEYQKYSRIKFKSISFRYFRLITSLIAYPYIYLRTLILINKK